MDALFVGGEMLPEEGHAVCTVGTGESPVQALRVVKVRFDHLGWAEVTDLFRDCSMSWAYFLESLRTLIEEGRGTPESFDSADTDATAV